MTKAALQTGEPVDGEKCFFFTR